MAYLMATFPMTLSDFRTASHAITRMIMKQLPKFQLT